MHWSLQEVMVGLAVSLLSGQPNSPDQHFRCKWPGEGKALDVSSGRPPRTHQSDIILDQPTSQEDLRGYAGVGWILAHNNHRTYAELALEGSGIGLGHQFTISSSWTTHRCVACLE